MPELSDDMYCSQQIVVPPMFPYLLRQYAKAAIRCQPPDLLRWSTAYFRCLSLNLPPPVKPRLEYPVPKDYEGITPGWLRALLYQFQNSTHVGFKVLWDRWIGACLQHDTLIKILTLGAFTEPMAVPFYRFLALCIGFICENLTQTMIVICEVLTEEPEGGSAMITVETFVDLYTFLANIDASKDQWLLNRYFTDALLDLLEKEAEKPPPPKPPSLPTPEKEPSLAPESVEEEEKTPESTGDVISCPDLDEDIDAAASDGNEDSEQSDDKSVSTVISDTERQQRELKVQLVDEVKQEEAVSKDLTEDSSTKKTSEDGEEGEEEEEEGEGEVDEGQGQETESNFNLDSIPSSDTFVSKPTKKAEEMEKGKTDVVEDYLKAIEEPVEELREQSEAPGEQDTRETYTTASAEEEEEASTVDSKFGLEEIFVEAIPGIGNIVPEELVKAVVEYMKNCAITQHGMVMPRNIRHYTCPPLEVFD